PSSGSSNATDELQVLCRVPTRELCFFRYTLEAHEGLCLPTTLPGGQGRIRLATSASQRPALEALLQALSQEIPLEVEEWSSAHCAEGGDGCRTP
ncbi:MAG TPA: DUF4911 domain-containing protein, partial [Deferrisomatales bacterium]|nr:DUF4911 domain-containing protein [Deferrisomatales bacterium]